MRKITCVFVTLSILLLVQSCIPSLHPLYSNDKKVNLDSLEGIWTDFPKYVQLTGSDDSKGVIVAKNEDGSGKPEIWNFVKKDDKGYLLIHHDNKGVEAAFEVYLVNLNGSLFMDFYPTNLPDESSQFSSIFNDGQNNMMSYHLLPVHTFAKLVVQNDEIKIKLFNPDFLEMLLKERRIRIKHESLADGGYLLTAQPEELQKFVEKYADNNDLYIEEEIALKKVN